MPFLKKKKRVLLLDDDASMQRLIASILRGAGYRVEVVSTGRQAIDRILKSDYAALLLDVMTPTEGGLTVVRHLREERPELLPRVILVTAAPASILKTVPDDVGILRKPFDTSELVAAVVRVVK